MIEAIAPADLIGEGPIELFIDITKEDHLKSAVIDSRRIMRRCPDVLRKPRRLDVKANSIVVLWSAIPAAYIAYDERNSLSAGGFLIVSFLVLTALVTAIRAGKSAFGNRISKAFEEATVASAMAQVNMSPGLLGHRTVLLSATELSFSTCDVIRKYMWSGIEYMAESKSEFFILPAVGTLVIPKRGLPDATVNAIRASLERYTAPDKEVDHVAEIDVLPYLHDGKYPEKLRRRNAILRNITILMFAILLGLCIFWSIQKYPL